ncbi:MAG: hypothetical protein KDH20_22795 [Rhodocyclaceae bacterium]|nr:hypothetical protein [Rhodocyclaceae bacterium]
MSDHGQGGGDKDALWSVLTAAGLPWRPLVDGDCLLAIDDTDNLDSRGTGFRARELALELAQAGLARPLGVTRHQLLVDDRIPYTSHNSSACLMLADASDPDALFAYGKQYLARTAAAGSDAGIVVARFAQVSARVRDWGRRAQREVLDKASAYALAKAEGLRMAELTGEGIGVIGALAAIGLNHQGEDGRCLWVRGLREAAGAVMSVAALTTLAGLAVRTRDGRAVTDNEADIALGQWPRAVFKEGRPILLVEENDDGTSHAPWRVVDRDIIKQH